MAVVYLDPGRTKTLSIANGGTDSDILDMSSGNMWQTVTRTITHGAAGGKDLMPDPSIVSITSVVQGATTYVVTTDYTVSGNQLDWSPAGAEPAAASQYTVTYVFNPNSAKAYRPINVFIQGPATMPETVKVYSAQTSGGSFGAVQSGGADISLGAAKTTPLIPWVGRFLKLTAGGAVGGQRDFLITAVSY